jgi:hypothetical protein
LESKKNATCRILRTIEPQEITFEARLAGRIKEYLTGVSHGVPEVHAMNFVTHDDAANGSDAVEA